MMALCANANVDAMPLEITSEVNACGDPGTGRCAGAPVLSRVPPRHGTARARLTPAAQGAYRTRSLQP